MFQLKNWGDSEAPIWLTTAIIVVNGDEQEIIPAFHSKNRVILSSVKDVDLIKKVDSTKLLDCRFNFCDSKVFVDAGIELFDIDCRRIPDKLPQGTPKVYVYLDDAVTYWQWSVRQVIPATILTFDSAKEALETVGTTDLFSRSLNYVESIGLAAAVSGNKTYDEMWRFATEFKVPTNTAALYLKVRKNNRRVSKIVASGIPVDKVPTQEREYEQAVKLYQAIAKASHDVKVAKNRYFISVINQSYEMFSLEEILQVLDKISYDEGEQFRIAGCDDKETCIRGVLRPYFMELRESKAKPDNAA